MKTEAAAEIERLRGELAHFTAERDRFHAGLTKTSDENERLREKVATLELALKMAQSDVYKDMVLDGLRARIAELEAAQSANRLANNPANVTDSQ